MSVNSKMKALADEIRELSGTTTSKSIDAMTSDIDAANAEIAEQAELLEQIATALENKATPSGGSENLDAELATQDDLIAGIKIALAGKASGGSGGVETVNVGIIGNAPSIPVYYIDGSNTLQEASSGVGTVLDIVVQKNSILLIAGTVYMLSSDTTVALSGYTIVFITSDAPNLYSLG